MAQQDLGNLSIDELKAKKKLASVLLGVMAAVLLVDIVVAVLRGRFDLLGVAAALFAIAIPIFLGVKRVSEELKRREGT